MKKLFQKICLAILGTIFLASAIFVSTASLPGNPTISELNSSTWKVSGPLDLSPERGRYALLYSLVENKSFQFSPEVARFATPDLGYFNGQYVSLFAPGVSFVMIPGYLLGKYFGFAHLGATLVIGLFAFLNTWLIRLILTKLGVSKLVAFTAALLFLVATPAFAYAGVIYQHHISTFCVLACLYLVLKPVNLKKLGLCFLIFGFSALIDVPNIFFITPIIIYGLTNYFKFSLVDDKIEFNFNLKVIFAGLGVVLPILIYLLINFYSYGNAFQLSNTVTHIQALDESGKPITGRGADERSINDIKNLGERKRNPFNFFKSRHLINGLQAFFISPDRGLLIFNPLSILGLVGIGVLFRKKPILTQTLLGIITLNILLYSMRSDPWGGWGFGSRYLIPSFSILAILLGIALNQYRKNLLFMSLFLGLGYYSIYVNIAGAISSIANPPKVEILALEALTNQQERFSYDRNLERLRQGSSKSFVFKTFLHRRLSAWEYFSLLVVTYTGVLSLLSLIIYLEKNHEILST